MRASNFNFSFPRATKTKTLKEIKTKKLKITPVCAVVVPKANDTASTQVWNNIIDQSIKRGLSKKKLLNIREAPKETESNNHHYQDDPNIDYFLNSFHGIS